jgi:hypothetical protein
VKQGRPAITLVGYLSSSPKDVCCRCTADSSRSVLLRPGRNDLGQRLTGPSSISSKGTSRTGSTARPANHAFHNGNRRTALESMLVPLDEDGVSRARATAPQPSAGTASPRAQGPNSPKGSRLRPEPGDASGRMARGGGNAPGRAACPAFVL